MSAWRRFSVYIERPTKTPAPAVVVLQEVFGVNKVMRQSCRELADHGLLMCIQN
ncbi:dienelactone hydrolase family protein [Dyella sp.]|uniref:dienelactone hydrolase family protein n=1 Tax=Dyella sp. TaxID=1869338 RepID=UPI0039C8A15D